MLVQIQNEKELEEVVSIFPLQPLPTVTGIPIQQKQN